MFGRSHSVRLVLIGLAIVALGHTGTLAQTRATAAPAEGSKHDFDFLLGNWEFIAESKLPGVPPKYPGRWTGERTGAGAIVEDDFIVTDDQGVRRYLGITLRAFDAKTKQWTTAFVVPPGAKWSVGRAWREGNEIAEGSDDATSGKRARFLDIAPDHFTWSMEQSNDGGKTWANMVRVQATRVAGSPQADTALSPARIPASK